MWAGRLQSRSEFQTSKAAKQVTVVFQLAYLAKDTEPPCGFDSRLQQRVLWGLVSCLVSTNFADFLEKQSTFRPPMRLLTLKGFLVAPPRS